MADKYYVGSSQKKDKYMVGYNEGKDVYYVGNKAKSGSGANGGGSSFSGSDQDKVVGGKSQFSYKDPDVKDPGDKSENMGFGGAISSGLQQSKGSAAGEIPLVYSEKGDWDTQKNAMARRKGMLDSQKQSSASGDGYKSPTVDLVSIKK